MTEKELEKYISAQLQQGIDSEVLKMALEREGVDSELIRGAFANIDLDKEAMSKPNLSETVVKAQLPYEPPPPPPMLEREVKLPRFFFMKLRNPFKKKTEEEIAAEAVAAKQQIKPQTPTTIESEVDTHTIVPDIVETDPIPVQLEKPKRKFFNKFFVIGFILIICLLAGGAYAYPYLTLTPEKIVAKSLMETASINSLDFEGVLKMEIVVPTSLGLFDPGLDDSNLEGVDEPVGVSKTKTYKAEVSFNGSSDLRNAEDPRSSANFKITVEGMNFAFETRTVGEFNYARLTEFPALGLFDTGSIRDQWYRFSNESLEKYYTDTGVEMPNDSQLTPEELDSIKNIYIKNPFLKFEQKLEPEVIDGTNTHHYKFAIDNAAAKNFIAEVMKIIFKDNPMILENMDTGLDELFKNFSVTNSEIWIGKKDYLPRRMDISALVKSDNPTEGRAQIDMSLLYKNYNNPTQIDAPFPVKDLEELLNGFGSSSSYPSDMEYDYMPEEFEFVE